MIAKLTVLAVEALSKHLATLDEAYETGESRRMTSLARTDGPGAVPASLAGLACWAQGLVAPQRS